MRPAEGAFPTDAVLAYDIEVEGRRLADLGLVGGADGITYPDLQWPTFVLASRLRRLLHGSCRKLHGGGEDAIVNAGEIIGSTLHDVARRPSVLFLTGDQIYGDDVDRRVFHAVRSITEHCTVDKSIPGLPPLADLGAGQRSAHTKRFFFTSDHDDNHVLGFGEYAALYLLAWNPDLSALGIDTAVVLGEEERAAVAVARRTLANVVTYMAFDDHEITDDWNINARWRRRVDDHPSGRRVVANGLAAYWAFQGWGNDPDAFDMRFKDAIEAHVSTPDNERTGRPFERALWDHPSWTYATPTRPVALVMDLRMRRGDRPSHLDVVELLHPDAYATLDQALARVGHVRGQPLVLVSPTPVLGHPLVERIQDNARAGKTAADFDAESWTAHRAGLPRLLAWLVETVAAPVCVVLSGDVHYGFHAVGTFEERGRHVVVAQLTSSSLRNTEFRPQTLQVADALLGFLGAEEVGWRRRPSNAVERLRDAARTAKAQLILETTDLGREPRAFVDEWFDQYVADQLSSPDTTTSTLVRYDRLRAERERMIRSDEPLILPKEIADGLDLRRASDWTLTRRFVPVAGPLGNRQNVIGGTNLGLVDLDLDHGVVSSVLTTRHGGTIDDLASAKLDLRPAAPGRRDRSTVRSVHDEVEVVRDHLKAWKAANDDLTWGKRVLPFGDDRLLALPKLLLPEGRHDHIKVQVHSIAFLHRGATLAGLATHLLRRFEALIPADQATAELRPAPPLGRGSEIRWRVSPAVSNPLVQFALEELVGDITRFARQRSRRRDHFDREVDRLLTSVLPNRTFDVRIDRVTGPTDRLFGFTVLTLSNHPYGGARSWQLRAYGDGLFDLTTAEFNTYAWLPDALFEIASRGAATRSLWTVQLGAFVADVGGVALLEPIDTVLDAVIRERDPVDTAVRQDTSFLAPERIEGSPLANWVRGNFADLARTVQSLQPVH